MPSIAGLLGKMFRMVFGDTKVLNRILFDITTTAKGDYDIAKVLGLLFMIPAIIVFLTIFSIVSLRTSTFDSVNFVAGVLGLGASLMQIASSIRIKNTTEPPLEEKQEKKE